MISNKAKYTFLASAIVILLFAFYGSFLTHKINLVTADLGRHIRNGEFLTQDSSVLRTNFYSYTEPDYPAENHHWGAGAIFYLLDRAGGITMVHLFFIGLSLATFGIFFWIAIRLTNPPSPSLPAKGREIGFASLAALPIIFLLAERTEIRPEAFSYFFAGLFLWILYKFRAGEASAKALLLLPLLQILWANTHIFFALGPLIIGAFLTESLLGNRRIFWKLAAALVVTAAACLVNPFGLAGALAPFTILREFGYSLAENQTVLFMQKLSRNPNLWIYPAVFVAVLLSLLAAFARDKKNFPWVGLFLFAGFSFLAWFQIRSITFFGFIALPVFAQSLGIAFGPGRDLRIQKSCLAAVLVILVIAASGNLLHYFPYWQNFGFGTEKNNDGAMAFFKARKLQGPMFNNYDIGGYLIYHLYPETKVFVDNRPEAYSVSFFKKIYIPMQENETVWQKVDEKYGFSSIVFSHNDATPWGQKFLRQRALDPDWATVYFDQYVIIMLKRLEQNQAVIDMFEIKF